MTSSEAAADLVARSVSIRGVVQGVGFRPFVYRLAVEHGLAGWVLNGASGVRIHAQGAAEQVARFVAALRASPPPAARIVEFEVVTAEPEQLAGFRIVESQREAAPTVRISPDLAVCEDCLRELRDPTDRRFRYPYVNCTNCGPRYSIIRRLPYDREQTTMVEWAMCPECRREYEDPADRRYHAQPIACPDCGPTFKLVDAAHDPNGPETLATGAAAIATAARMLAAGRIVAVKGLGGYHLACDAANPLAVAELRTRKFRKEQSLAVMARDIALTESLVELDELARSLLLDVARPIVLAPRKVELPGVAPDSDTLGVMLPYAPLHHLLFDFGAPPVLVFTSGNPSSEPIAYRDDDALERLSGIADALLVGERPIARRVDDSVVAVRQGRLAMVRRARGFAPGIVARLPTEQPILAVGADLKGAVAVVVRGEVLMSQHLGDLDDNDSRLAFEETIADLLAMYDLRPEQLIVAHDLHPQFFSTRFALGLPALRHVAVQHHEAHLASVLAEHDLCDEQSLGVAFDGTGFGTDGTIWGGELFVGSVRAGFERFAWLRPARLPGGDAAARFPVQAAAGFLAELPGSLDFTTAPFDFPRRYHDARQLVDRNVRCHGTTSIGRLFDTVAALVGFTRGVTFEGQAAMWLEHLARQSSPEPAYDFAQLDYGPLLTAVVHDRLAGRAPAAIAYCFHAGLAQAVVDLVARECRARSIGTVVLSGGVFQNRLLVELTMRGFAEHAGLRLLLNSQVPAGDGGIALGQAAIAACRIAYSRRPLWTSASSVEPERGPG